MLDKAYIAKYALRRTFSVSSETKGNSVEGLVDVLPEDGSAMSFDEFKVAARAAGENPVLWLKAKHKGLLITEFDENQNLVIRRVTGEGS